MNRVQLRDWIAERYGVQPQMPWAGSPGHWVFRHSSNRKWFALILDVPRNRLGLPGEGKLDVVNLKCDPRLGATLRREPGYFPAYHMNKEMWISVALDGSASEENLMVLVEMSYELTKGAGKGSGKASEAPGAK